MPSSRAAKQQRNRARKKDSGELRNLVVTTSRGVDIPPEFRVSAFSDCTFVRGGTLERFWERPTDTHLVFGGRYFLVRRLPATQIRNQCDACVGQHEPTNLVCSQTLDRESPYTDESVLYNFYSKAGPHYKYLVLDEQVVPGARVGAIIARLEPVD
jgi:hypothetical protein